MSPRPYNLGKRQDHIDRARRQILDAARELLGEITTYRAFTIDAVARRADVARGTVYYQYRSKTGLLEALCDDLGQRGGLDQLPDAFTQPDPLAALAGFITIFARFWMTDRTVMRRLRALAALEPEVHAIITVRDRRRHDGLAVLVRRLTDHPCDGQQQLVRTLVALTSFETFDTLIDPDQDISEVASRVIALAAAVITHEPPRPL